MSAAAAAAAVTYNREILHKLIDMIRIAILQNIDVSGVCTNALRDLSNDAVKYGNSIPANFTDNIIAYLRSKPFPSSPTIVDPSAFNKEQKSINAALRAMFFIANSNNIDIDKAVNDISNIWFSSRRGDSGADDDLADALALGTGAGLAAEEAERQRRETEAAVAAAAEEVAGLGSAAAATDTAIVRIGATHTTEAPYPSGGAGAAAGSSDSLGFDIPTPEEEAEAIREYASLTQVPVRMKVGDPKKAEDFITSAMRILLPSYNPTGDYSLLEMLKKKRPVIAPVESVIKVYIQILSNPTKRGKIKIAAINNLLDNILVQLKAKLRPQTGAGRRRTRRRRRSTKTNRPHPQH